MWVVRSGAINCYLLSSASGRCYHGCSGNRRGDVATSLAPLALEYSDEGAPEVAVAQGVTDGVYGAVYITQPISCNRTHDKQWLYKNYMV